MINLQISVERVQGSAVSGRGVSSKKPFISGLGFACSYDPTRWIIFFESVYCLSGLGIVLVGAKLKAKTKEITDMC